MRLIEMRLLILVLYCLVGLTAKAQQDKSLCTLILKGQIVDEHDQSALSFSVIQINELNKSYQADSSGQFTITDLCPGEYTLLVFHVGCETRTQKLVLKNNQRLVLKLEHHPHAIDAVEIHSFKQNVKEGFVADKIQGEELQRMQGGNLADMLQKVAGISTLQSGATIAKPVLHGMHSNRLLLLSNGVRLEAQQWGSEHAPEIDPFLANQVTVVKGAMSVRYGSDAVAGAVLVEPKPLTDSTELNVKTALIGNSNGKSGASSVEIEHRPKAFPRLVYRVQGSARRSGDLHTPRYNLKNTALKEYNFSWETKLDLKPFSIGVFYSQFNTQLGILSAAHIGNVTDLLNAFEREVPLETGNFSYGINRPYQHVEHEVVKAYLKRQRKRLGELDLVVSRQFNRRKEYDKHLPRKDSLAQLNLPELQYQLTTWIGELNWEKAHDERLKSFAGITAQQQGNSTAGRFFIPNYKSHAWGTYAIEQFTFNKGMLQAGFRYDAKSATVYIWEQNQLQEPFLRWNRASGQLAAKYQLAKELQLDASVGTAWRAPSINELFADGIHHGAASYEKGDSQLKAEQSWNTTLHLSYEKEAYFTASVTGYIHAFDNYIFAKPVFPPRVTIRGAFPLFQHTQVKALIQGTDINLNYTPGKHWRLSAQYALVRGYNQTEKQDLLFMPADGGNIELGYALKSGKLLKEPLVSINFGGRFKQTRVPENSDFVAPPNGYGIVAMECSTKLQIKQYPLFVSLRVTNLLNQSYREYLNRFRYYADEPGRNVRLQVALPIQVKK